MIIFGIITGSERIMKTGNVIKFSLGCLIGLSLVGCSEYKEPVSHFAHGTHRCFYHDVRTGQFFKGVGESEKEARYAARNACIKKPPADLEHQYCEFAECLFK